MTLVEDVAMYPFAGVSIHTLTFGYPGTVAGAAVAFPTREESTVHDAGLHEFWEYVRVVNGSSPVRAPHA